MRGRLSLLKRYGRPPSAHLGFAATADTHSALLAGCSRPAGDGHPVRTERPIHTMKATFEQQDRRSAKNGAGCRQTGTCQRPFDATILYDPQALERHAPLGGRLTWTAESSHMPTRKPRNRAFLSVAGEDVEAARRLASAFSPNLIYLYEQSGKNAADLWAEESAAIRDSSYQGRPPGSAGEAVEV
jgi:hypothetical protein